MSITLKDLDIITSRVSTSELVVTDTIGTSKRITLANFMANWPGGTASFDIDALTEITSLEDDDFFVVLDDTDGQHKKIAKDNVESELGGGGGTEYPYVSLKDIKSSGTNGGTFSNGAWQTRDLNTKDIDTDSICTLSSNQFTLPSGDFRVFASSPAYNVGYHQIRIYNTSDTATTLVGTSEYTDPSNYVQNRSFCFGDFTLASSKTLELQHRCGTSKATDGFGVGVSFGEDLMYSFVRIWKIG